MKSTFKTFFFKVVCLAHFFTLPIEFNSSNTNIRIFPFPDAQLCKERFHDVINSIKKRKPVLKNSGKTIFKFQNIFIIRKQNVKILIRFRR